MENDSIKINSKLKDISIYFLINILSFYSILLTFLMLLTVINDLAGYQLNNFLGSNINFETVVLHSLPGNNPYHLQKWISFPIGNFIALLLVSIFLIYSSVLFYKKNIKYYFGNTSIVLPILSILISILFFGSSIISIIHFISKLL